MATTPVNLPAGYQLDAPSLPAGYTLDPQTSAIGALGRGAIDALPFGTKGIAAGEAALGQGTYKSYLNELDSLLSSDREQHPIAHGAGELAGSVAPLAIPGVGEVLGAETLAGRAGIGAGIGALQAASNTRAPLTSTQGLQDIAKGAGTGAVLNPAIGALGDLVTGGATKAVSNLEDYANAEAVKSGGFPAKMLGRATEQEVNTSGQFMRGNDLVNGSLPERLQKAQVVRQVYGNKIGEMGDKAATLNDPAPYVQDLLNKSDQYSGMSNTEAKSLGNNYLTGAQDITNELPKGSSYQDIQRIKDLYGDLAFDAAHQVKNQANADTYFTLKKMQQDLVDNSPKEFQEAMKGYGTSSDIVAGLQRQLGISRAGSPVGGMGVAKVIRQIPGLEKPAIGLPAGLGLMGLGKTFTGAMVAGQALSNPAFKSQTAGVLSNAASSLGNLGNKAIAPAVVNAITNQNPAPKIPPQYAPVFQKATAGLTDPAEKQKQMTITDFVLQSRDPNYVKVKQDMENENRK